MKAQSNIPGSSPRPAGWLLMALVGLPVFAMSQVSVHMRVDEADSWLFAYYGQQILAGAELYGDYWDNKPPGVFWVNAVGLGLTGGHYGGVIAICVAACVLSLLFFYDCARRWFGGSTAALGVSLAAILLWLPLYRGGSNRPETFVVLCDLAAMWAYTCGLRCNRRRWWWATGFFVAASLVFKQTGVAAGLAIGGHLLWTAIAQPAGRRAILGAGLVMLASAFGTVAGAVGVLGLTGDLDWAWYAVVRFVGLYASTSDAEFAWPRWFGLREHVQFLALPMMLAAVGLALAVARIWDHRVQRATSPDYEQAALDARSAAPQGLLLLLTLWLSAAAYLVFVGPSRAFHYVPTALAPLLLLATWTLHIAAPLPDPSPVQGRVYRWLAVLWLAFMCFRPLESHVRWVQIAAHDRYVDEHPFNTHLARRFVEAHAAPDDPIYVWDYRPRIYWEMKRPCPSRFTTTLNIGQIGSHGQAIIDNIAADFAARPPQVVLLTRHTAEALAAGERDGVVSWRALGAWLCEHYAAERQGDPRSMLVRRADAAGGM